MYITYIGNSLSNLQHSFHSKKKQFLSETLRQTNVVRLEKVIHFILLWHFDFLMIYNQHLSSFL